MNTIVFVSLTCSVILTISVVTVLILQQFFKSPQSYKTRHQRILVFCISSFIILIGLFTTAFAFEEAVNVDNGCDLSHDINACRYLEETTRVEIWLHLLLFPITTQDTCFTGTPQICNYVHNHVFSNVTTSGRLTGYLLIALMFAIPPSMLYMLLKATYIKPHKRKQKPKI